MFPRLRLQQHYPLPRSLGKLHRPLNRHSTVIRPIKHNINGIPAASSAPIPSITFNGTSDLSSPASKNRVHQPCCIIATANTNRSGGPVSGTTVGTMITNQFARKKIQEMHHIDKRNRWNFLELPYSPYSIFEILTAGGQLMLRTLRESEAAQLKDHYGSKTDKGLKSERIPPEREVSSIHREKDRKGSIYREAEMNFTGGLIYLEGYLTYKVMKLRYYNENLYRCRRFRIIKYPIM